MRRALNKDGDATFACIEAFPQREGNGSGYSLLGRDVFDSAKLFEFPNNEVVGKDTPFVLSSSAVGHQTVFVQCNHYVGALAVHLCPQSTR